MRFILWWDGVIKQAEKRRDKHKVRWETTRSKMRWEEMRWDTKWDETGREVGKRYQTEWDEINQSETKPEKTRRCKASVVWCRHKSWNHIHLVAMKGHLLYISVTDYRLSMRFIFFSSDQASSWLYWRSVLSHLLCYLSSVNEIRPCGCWLASLTLTD